MTPIDAQQRIAIVTGAARGIGAAVTHRLAADGLGVAVLDRDKDGAEAVASSITRTGGRAMAITADVTSSEQIEDAVASVCAGLGDPDWRSPVDCATTLDQVVDAVIATTMSPANLPGTPLERLETNRGDARPGDNGPN
jgi:NAD(P)-dependent dehydrogenase (short-subunit alcohol dehydrogenase family)